MKALNGTAAAIYLSHSVLFSSHAESSRAAYACVCQAIALALRPRRPQRWEFLQVRARCSFQSWQLIARWAD